MQVLKNHFKVFLSKTITIFVLFLFLSTLSSCAANKSQLGQKVEKYMNALIKEKNDQLSVKAGEVKLDDKTDTFIVKLDVLKEGKKVSQNRVFVSRDGKLLSVTPMINLNKKPGEEKADLPKKNKPEVKLFVMTGCPFGTQAEEVFAPVVKKLGDQIEFTPHYIIYSGYEDQKYCIDQEKKYCSMHGKTEAEEGVRQICIWNDYQEKWWDYIEKFNKDCNPNDPAAKPEECSKKTAESLEIDFAKVKECSKNYASLLDQEIKAAEKYKAKGSPTIIINDKPYEGDRDPKKIFETICNSFKKQPAVCKEEFNPAISSKAPSSGGCGN